MSSFIKFIAALLLCSFSAFGAATTNKTPILRGLLQGNLDGNTQSITNLGTIVSVNESVTGNTTNTGAYILNGSGSVMNRIGPYSAPNYSGFSFYGTNYASGNALSDWADWTTNGFDILQFPVMARHGLTVSNDGTATGTAFFVAEQGRVISITNSGTGANSLLLSVKSAEPFQVTYNPHLNQSNRATITLSSNTSWNGQARALITADGDINFRPNNFTTLTLNDTNAFFNTNITTTGIKVDGPAARYDWMIATNGVIAAPAWNGDFVGSVLPGVSFFNTNGNYMGGIDSQADHGGVSDKPELIFRSQRNIAIAGGFDGLNDAGTQMGFSGPGKEIWYLQYDEDPTGGQGPDGITSWPFGHSKRLGFAARGSVGALGANSYEEAFPGIVGATAATNIIPTLKSGAAQLGELRFYTSLPQYQAGNYFNTYPGMMVGRMGTNGWWFKGSMGQENVVTTGSSYVYDFTLGYAQTVDASSTTITITTANLPASTTNIQQGRLLIRSGPFTIGTLTLPSWKWGNEAGTATAPTTLAANKVLDIHLEALGSSDANVIASYKIASWPFTYDTDASAFFTAASITDDTQKQAINTFVLSAKAGGWWTLCDAIYPFVGGNATAHSKNLKGSSFTINWAVTPTHNANGITGNGSSMYGDTTYTASTAGGQMTQNSAHLFLYCRTQNPIASRLASTTSGTHFLGLQRQAGNGLAPDGVNANGGSGGFQNPAITVNDTRGCLLIMRTNSTAQYMFYGDTGSSVTVAGSTGGNSSGLADTSLYVLARNSSGPANYTDANLAGMSLGAGLTAGQITSMLAAWRAFETTLGRNTP